MKLTAKRRRAAERALTAGFAKALRYVQLRVAEEAARAATTIVAAAAPGQDQVPTVAGLPLATAAATINPAAVYDPRWWRNGYNRYTRKPAKVLYDDTAARAADELGVDYDPDDPAVAVAWDELDDADVEEWGAGLVPFVEGQVAAGVAAGDTVEGLVARLRDSAESWFSPGRAILLAAVATAATYNRATVASADGARAREGVRSTKTWVTVGDDRVRDAHVDMDGVTVDAAADFLLEGQYPAAGPHDPRLPIDLKANCRCWLELSGEGQAGDDETATLDFGADDDGGLVASGRRQHPVCTWPFAGFDEDKHPRGPDGRFLPAGEVGADVARPSGLPPGPGSWIKDANGNWIPDRGSHGVGLLAPPAGQRPVPHLRDMDRGQVPSEPQLDGKTIDRGDRDVTWSRDGNGNKSWSVGTSDGYAVRLHHGGVDPDSLTVGRDADAQARIAKILDDGMASSILNGVADAYELDPRPGGPPDVLYHSTGEFGRKLVDYGHQPNDMQALLYADNVRAAVLSNEVSTPPFNMPAINVLPDVMARPYKENFHTAGMEAHSDRVAATLAHEYGHVRMNDQVQRSPADGLMARKKIARLYNEAPDQGLSEYAEENEAEAYAEAYADWHLTRGTTINSTTATYADELGWRDFDEVEHALAASAGDVAVRVPAGPAWAILDCVDADGKPYSVIVGDDPFANLDEPDVGFTAGADWDPEKHPRGEGGRFGAGSAAAEALGSDDIDQVAGLRWLTQAASAPPLPSEPDAAMSAMAERLGVDGPPTLVDRAGLDQVVAEGGTYMARGISPGRTGRSAEQFLTGDPVYSHGMLGAGIYTAYADPAGAKDQAWADRLADTYAEQAAGETVRMALKPDANVIDLADVGPRQKALLADWRAEVDKATEAGDTARAADYQAATDFMGNVGHWAMAHGYDALRWPESNFMVVYNRAALVAEKADQLAASADWDPAKHPRDAAGRFGEGDDGGEEATQLDLFGEVEAGEATAKALQSNDPYQIAELPWLESASRSYMGDPAIRYGRDPYMAHIAPAMGLVGNPDVGSIGDIDDAVDAGATYMARGFRDIYGDNTPISVQAELFRTGEPDYHPGAFGTGIYTAYSGPGSRLRSGADAVRVAESYAQELPDGLMRMALKADARVVDSHDAEVRMHQQFKLWTREADFASKTDPELGKRLYAARDAVAADVGRWAAAHGYQAIKVPSEGYMVIFDRAALLVEEPPESKKSGVLSVLGLGRFDWDPAKHPRGEGGRFGEGDPDDAAGYERVGYAEVPLIPGTSYQPDLATGPPLRNPAAARALRDYKTAGYLTINGRLRDPDFDLTDDSPVPASVAALTAEIDNLHDVGADVTVWRSFDPDRVHLEPGMRFTDKGFTSTDRGGEVAARWRKSDHVMAIALPKGTRAIAAGGAEHELILQRGTTFEVVGKLPSSSSVWGPKEKPTWEVRVVAQRPKGDPDNLNASADWDPEKHPRGPDGKFGPGVGVAKATEGWGTVDDIPVAEGFIPELVSRDDAQTFLGGLGDRYGIPVKVKVQDYTVRRTFLAGVEDSLNGIEARYPGILEMSGVQLQIDSNIKGMPRGAVGGTIPTKWALGGEAEGIGVHLSTRVIGDSVSDAGMRQLTDEKKGLAPFGVGEYLEDERAFTKIVLDHELAHAVHFNATALDAIAKGFSGPTDPRGDFSRWGRFVQDRIQVGVDGEALTEVWKPIQARYDADVAAAVSGARRFDDPKEAAAKVPGSPSRYAMTSKTEWLAENWAAHEAGGEGAHPDIARIMDDLYRKVRDAQRQPVAAAARPGTVAAVPLPIDVYPSRKPGDAWPPGFEPAPADRPSEDGDGADLTALGLGQFADWDEEKHPRGPDGKFLPAGEVGADEPGEAWPHGGGGSKGGASGKALKPDSKEVRQAAKTFKKDYGVTLNFPAKGEKAGVVYGGKVDPAVLSGIESSLHALETAHPGLARDVDLTVTLADRIGGRQDGILAATQPNGWNKDGTPHIEIVVDAEMVTSRAADAEFMLRADTAAGAARYHVSDYEPDPERVAKLIFDHEFGHGLHMVAAMRDVVASGLKPTNDKAWRDRLNQATLGDLASHVEAQEEGWGTGGMVSYLRNDRITQVFEPLLARYEQDQRDASTQGSREGLGPMERAARIAGVPGSPSRYAMETKSEWVAENWASLQNGLPTHPEFPAIADDMVRKARGGALTASAFGGPPTVDGEWICHYPSRRPGELWPPGWEPDAVTSLTASADWDPEKHPRGPDGRFGPGDGADAKWTPVEDIPVEGPAEMGGDVASTEEVMEVLNRVDERYGVFGGRFSDNVTRSMLRGFEESIAGFEARFPGTLQGTRIFFVDAINIPNAAGSASIHHYEADGTPAPMVQLSTDLIGQQVSGGTLRQIFDKADGAAPYGVGDYLTDEAAYTKLLLDHELAHTLHYMGVARSYIEREGPQEPGFSKEQPWGWWEGYLGRQVKEPVAGEALTAAYEAALKPYQSAVGLRASSSLPRGSTREQRMAEVAGDPSRYAMTNKTEWLAENWAAHEAGLPSHPDTQRLMDDLYQAAQTAPPRTLAGPRPAVAAAARPPRSVADIDVVPVREPGEAWPVGFPPPDLPAELTVLGLGAFEFDPAKHPRDAAGRFGEGDGSTAGGVTGDDLIDALQQHGVMYGYVNPEDPQDAIAAPDMSDRMEEALHGYLRNPDAINGELRNVRVGGDQLWDPRGSSADAESAARERGNILVLAGAAKRLPVDAVLYRGVNAVKAFGDHEPQVGDAFIEDGFMSTSADRGLAEGFATYRGRDRAGYLMEVHAPAGTRAVAIDNGMGLLDESEVMLAPGATYEVVDVRPGDSARALKGTLVVEVTGNDSSSLDEVRANRDYWKAEAERRKAAGLTALGLGRFDFDPAKHPKDEKGRWTETEGGAGGGEGKKHWWDKLLHRHHDDEPVEAAGPARDEAAAEAFRSGDPKKIVELDWLMALPVGSAATSSDTRLAGAGERDQAAAAIAAHLGADGPPKAVVDQLRLDIAALHPGALYAVRGVHDSTMMSGRQAAEAVRSGPAWYSMGVMGSGTYAAYAGGSGATQAKLDKDAAEKAAGSYAAKDQGGTTVRMVLDADAPVVTFGEARVQAQRVATSALKEAATARRAGDHDLAGRYEKVAAVMADPGRWALANDYDAIVQPKEGYIAILDRSQLVVEAADAAKKKRGYTALDLGVFADWDPDKHPRGAGGRFGEGDAGAEGEPELVGPYRLPLLAGTARDPDLHTGPVPNPLGAAMDFDHYQGYGHVAINGYLRGPADDPTAFLQKVAVGHMTREIDANHTVPHAVTAWRTFNTDDLALTPGTQFTDKGFTSTDLNGEMARTWRDQTAAGTGLMAIRVPEGTRGIARDVGEGRELILQRGTTYEVVRRLPGDGPPTWELNVVDQRPKGRDPSEWATLGLGAFADWDPEKHPKGRGGRFIPAGHDPEGHWMDAQGGPPKMPVGPGPGPPPDNIMKSTPGHGFDPPDPGPNPRPPDGARVMVGPNPEWPNSIQGPGTVHNGELLPTLPGNVKADQQPPTPATVVIMDNGDTVLVAVDQVAPLAPEDDPAPPPPPPPDPDGPVRLPRLRDRGADAFDFDPEKHPKGPDGKFIPAGAAAAAPVDWGEGGFLGFLDKATADYDAAHPPDPPRPNRGASPRDEEAAATLKKADPVELARLDWLVAPARIDEERVTYDSRLEDIARRLGVDGRPELVDSAVIDERVDDGAIYATRGLSDRGGLEGWENANEFRNGDAHWTTGAYGSGIYAAAEGPGSDLQRGQADEVAATYASMEPGGTVVRMVLRDDAKVLDYRTAERTAEAAWEAATNAPADTPDLAARLRVVREVVADPGRWAMMQGYDAILNRDNGYMTILNRAALLVEDDPNPLAASAEWDEEKHPRDEKGRFGPGAGDAAKEVVEIPGADPNWAPEEKLPTSEVRAVLQGLEDRYGLGAAVVTDKPVPRSMLDGIEDSVAGFDARFPGLLRDTKTILMIDDTIDGYPHAVGANMVRLWDTDGRPKVNINLATDLIDTQVAGGQLRQTLDEAKGDAQFGVGDYLTDRRAYTKIVMDHELAHTVHLNAAVEGYIAKYGPQNPDDPQYRNNVKFAMEVREVGTLLTEVFEPIDLRYRQAVGAVTRMVYDTSSPKYRNAAAKIPGEPSRYAMTSQTEWLAENWTSLQNGLPHHPDTQRIMDDVYQRARRRELVAAAARRPAHADNWVIDTVPYREPGEAWPQGYGPPEPLDDDTTEGGPRGR